jgi:hypothetical protein
MAEEGAGIDTSYLSGLGGFHIRAPWHMGRSP